MPCVSAPQNGLYLLEVHRKSQPLPFIHARFSEPGGTDKSIFLPSLPVSQYLLNVRGETKIEIDAPNIERMKLRRLTVLEAKIRGRRRKDQLLSMSIWNESTITPLLSGAGPRGRELRKALKLIARWGFTLASDNIQRTPDLFKEIDTLAITPTTPANTSDESPRFAIVLHLYYRDLWLEFEHRLRALTLPFHLIITTTERDPEFETRIRRSFPSADILVYENRGRDVGPFLQLLHEGRLDAFPFICKLHGKRSGNNGARALLGAVWLRANIVDLIGSDAQVRRIINRFEHNPYVGVIGSDRFRLPNNHISDEVAWAENRDMTLKLVEQMGVSPTDFELDFFAGTMFWISQNALAPIRKLNLTLDDFPMENGAVDGELAHAVERVFGVDTHLSTVIAPKTDKNNGRLN
jgi:lipopolysaccharide biosynthesis protein